MSRLNVSLRHLPGDIVALDLAGFVDRHTVQTLDESLGRLIEQGRTRLVVNCADLGYLSSSGIGVFMAQLIRVHKADGDLKFYGMNRHVRTLMEVAGFSKVLEIYDTESEAVAKFQNEAHSRKEEEAVEAHSLAMDVRPVGSDTAVIQLRGDIDRHTIGALERELTRVIEDGRARLVVDCGGVTFLSSNGMGVFIQYVQRARAHQGDIRFCQMRDNALTVITMLGLQNIFQVFQTEEEALASYKA